MKIAIVAQRYGEEVNGGAELHARWLAEHLLQLADVDVITSCAIDYNTWANDYEPGESELDGIRILRFSVDKERVADMHRRTAEILLQDHTLFDEFRWVKDQGPYSTDMFDYIRRSYNEYDFFIFFTYLYAPTFFGLPLVSDKAILVPTAHEEPYIELPAFRGLFHLPRIIIYNTEPEWQHVNQVTQNYQVPGIVAGIGINVPGTVSGPRFRKKFGIDDDFILYVGRVDISKNVPQLLDFYSRYRLDHNRKLKLVLIGKVNMPLPDNPDIMAMGFVTEEDKFDALQAASALAVPSKYESLSMVSLESWLMETPVVANGQCTVLKHQCRQSNGGLYYHTYNEFSQALTLLLDNPDLRKQLGRQGRDFVKQRYDWDIVVAKYQAVFEVLST
ncbi:MAG: glycosyltransferase family 4 protein [Candidatus Promineifilaceae bacterium]|nr:glycosyltransferase family 4 protein [Candidatus Promineifilaceae bacterium]